MGEERRSSPSVCLHDFFAQKFDGVLFNARYIGARNPEHGSDLVLRMHHAVLEAVTQRNDQALPLGQAGQSLAHVFYFL